MWRQYLTTNTAGKNNALDQQYLTMRERHWSCRGKCATTRPILSPNCSASSCQIDRFINYCLWTDCCPQNNAGSMVSCLFFMYGTGTCSLCPSVNVHNPSFYFQQKLFFINIQIFLFCGSIIDDRNSPKGKYLTKSKHVSQVISQTKRSWCSILKLPRDRLGPGSPSQWYSHLLHQQVFQYCFFITCKTGPVNCHY